MSDQAKLYKLIRLINLLSGGRRYTRPELMGRLETSERSLYRYLQTLEQAGLILERTNGYRLAKEDSIAANIKQLFHFTEEEAYVLRELLQNTVGEQEVRKKLMRKLHVLYDFKVLANKEDKPEWEHIQQLKKALQNKQCVLLKNYRSSNSQRIDDRTVEPFGFSPEYKAVWAFDQGDKTSKLFRLSRMEEVILLKVKQAYSHLHKEPFVDAFRMNAEKPMDTIHLKLTLKAYNLLKEEFPPAMEFVTIQPPTYELSIPVAKYEGVGRFVLGLPEDVEVLGSEAFRRFVEEKVKSFQQLTVVGSEGV